ncbi:PHD finger protein 20 [Chanos chanos]|uniref:PHD finger protein 20 n=1 Tax=Chanos chanos TaxID=29144 RepID=A0A6J2VSH5_CHACN|nr:PHD finger protein 20-like [Chanos chanos]
MSKTPPNRRGITFEVGAQLEARDSLKNWYAANIEKIDYDDEKVLIHYRQWSHRYDEWFDWASPYLRPVERIQLRREGLQEDSHIPGFHVNDKVLASWSDCRFYPAKVLAVHKDASYTVKFYDGVIQTVKGIHVKPFIRERQRQKSQSSDKTTERHSARGIQRVRDRRAQENGGCKSKRVSRNTSDEEFCTDTEEEDDEEDADSDEWDVEHANEESHAKMDVHSEGAEDDGKKKTIEGRKAQKRKHEEQSVCIKTESERADEGEINKETAEKHSCDRSFCTENRELAVEDGFKRAEVMQHSASMNEDEREKLSEVKKETEATHLEGHVQSKEEEGEEEEEVDSQGLPQTKRAREDKHSPDESKPSTELANHTVTEVVPESVPTPSEQAAGDHKTEDKSDDSKAVGETNPAPPVKSVRKQGFHNPNRFSREPLYRVIKNQPPPVLSINLDHNPFKCSAPGCPKSFRKAKLLHYHMKYYHGDDRPIDEDLSPTRRVQTRTTDKQATVSNRESPKRRRTISASMYSTLHSPIQTPTSPRVDGKASIQLTEKRRTSAPPIVNVQNFQQRPSLKERSKENQLDRNGRRTIDREKEKSAADMGERDRLKDKRTKDFLHIKLKKMKKKKKSKSEYTGSEENIGISILASQPKLNLHLKLPLSHKHTPEAYHCRPGHRQSEQRCVDDEDSLSDWSSDSCGWSEDESGTDLDTTQPLGYSARRGQEIIRCVCEVEEENDFMIQCEECLCWQHGTCMGLLEDSIPDRYTCYICRDPPGQRQSLRYWYDRDWLSSGHMYGLSFLEENYSHQNAKKITATHQLLGDVHRVVEVLNGLQLKMNVLQTQTHPDLKLWCQPWKRLEKPVKKSSSGTELVRSPASIDEGHNRQDSPVGLNHSTEDRLSRAPSSSSSFHESYISSEHCYQKPRAYYPALEQRLVVETRRSSELEDNLRSTEDLLEYEQRCGGQLHPDSAKIPSSHHGRGSRSEWATLGKLGEVVSAGGNKEARDTAQQQQQWQINLLDHIEAVQEEVTHRMDFIEKELDVLESWLDYTGELEPPEPLARLPQLKLRIKQLLTELGKVQQIALSCST